MEKAYNAADIHPIYMRAFNAGDIEATVACYEDSGCFVSASGRIARGAAELREVYRKTFAARPTFHVEVRKVLEAGNDLALVIGEWTSKAQMPTGDMKIWSGTYTDIVRKQSDGTWKLVLDNSHGVEPSKAQST
ncbi:YybH family protein [Bradyrhizobium sp. USDA 4454]